MKQKRSQNLSYHAPRISWSIIELEQGIASSSATFTPGNGQQGNSTPEYQDWEVEISSQNQDF